MVEIDEQVVNVCKEYLPQTACAFDDPRLTLYIEDGLKFVRRKENEYDLIIVDSTDPFGPERDFTKEFYGNCSKALTDCGILINQHESTYYDSYVDMVKRTQKNRQCVPSFNGLSDTYTYLSVWPLAFRLCFEKSSPYI